MGDFYFIFIFLLYSGSGSLKFLDSHIFYYSIFGGRIGEFAKNNGTQTKICAFRVTVKFSAGGYFASL